MESIIISEYLENEEYEISKLIHNIFHEFISWDFTEEGNSLFLDFIIPENLKERISKGNIALTAKNNNKIVGMIEIKDYNHICLLFVDKEFQKNGIARLLFTSVLKIIKENSRTAFIDVNSSIYAVPIYQKLGFTAQNSVQDYAGIKYVPMAYQI